LEDVHVHRNINGSHRYCKLFETVQGDRWGLLGRRKEGGGEERRGGEREMGVIDTVSFLKLFRETAGVC
jgi:hypothetical protein